MEVWADRRGLIILHENSCVGALCVHVVRVVRVEIFPFVVSYCRRAVGVVSRRQLHVATDFSADSQQTTHRHARTYQTYQTRCRP